MTKSELIAAIASLPIHDDSLVFIRLDNGSLLEIAEVDHCEQISDDDLTRDPASGAAFGTVEV